MRVDVTDLARAAGAAVPSLYRPHPRHRSAVTGVAGAGVLTTVTVNRLNQDASGTLSPPASRAELTWLRGDGKTSDWGTLASPVNGQLSANHVHREHEADLCFDPQQPSCLGESRTKRYRRRVDRNPTRHAGVAPASQTIEQDGVSVTQSRAAVFRDT